MMIRCSVSVPSELEGPIGDAQLAASDWKQVRTHLCVLLSMIVCTVIFRYRPEWVMGVSLQCIMRSVFHLKCPFCGMTRDFVAILHGNRPELNPFSWLAVIGIYFAYPLVFVWAWQRRKLDLFYRPAVYRLVAVGLVVMFVINNLHK
jgi:hypothetical protein